MTILNTLESFLTREANVQAGDRILVAFSGGPDSSALLWAMTRVAPRRQVVTLAAHLDHALDEDSPRRAQAAAQLCKSMGVPLQTERRAVASLTRSGESIEAASRRWRYEFLEDCRRRAGARFTLTAHHADDQIETLLLRLTFGSGLAGLSGIAVRRDRVLRPFLDHRRSELREAVQRAGIEPIIDPTNFELTATRNRLRHLVIPGLLAEDPLLRDRLGRLPKAARQAQARIERFLLVHLGLRTRRGEVAVDRHRLAELPPEVLSYALGLMHRSAGISYPPSSKARSDLHRQLESAGTIGCDCGGGWRWESDSARLRLCRNGPQQAPFAYTLKVPGECDIPEAGLRFRLEPGRTAEWMFASSPRRVGLSLPIAAGDEVTIRNRRPGDRLRPLGCAYTRRLKDVLMDRRVPRRERDRLPLLFVDSRLAWVPGVTVNEDFKVGEGESVWVGQIDPL